MLRGTAGLLLDGSWHHLAVSISSDPSARPYRVFIDGEPWEPDFVDSAWFLRKGLAVGGALNVGQLEIVDKGEPSGLGQDSARYLVCIERKSVAGCESPSWGPSAAV